MIYFLHIPKTSGSAVEAAITTVDNRWPQSFVFAEQVPAAENKKELIDFFSSKDFKNCNFIKGHFACTPYLYAENIQAFSLIREPLERSISYFKYFNAAKDIRYPESFYYFLDTSYNLQSAHLTSCLKWKPAKPNDPHEIELDIPNFSFEELLLKIKERNITLSTVDNRSLLLDAMGKTFSNLLNKDIKLNTDYITNEGYRVQYNPFTMDLSCLTEEVKEKFKIKNSLDYQLYNYVKDHETKTGRSLTPSDI